MSPQPSVQSDNAAVGPPVEPLSNPADFAADLLMLELRTGHGPSLERAVDLWLAAVRATAANDEGDAEGTLICDTCGDGGAHTTERGARCDACRGLGPACTVCRLPLAAGRLWCSWCGTLTPQSRPLTDRELGQIAEHEWERQRDRADPNAEAQREYERGLGGVGGPVDDRGNGGCDDDGGGW